MPKKQGFTHHCGSENGTNMRCIFYLYFNTDDTVDFHKEMNTINKFLSENDSTGAWKETSVFKVCDAEKWSNHDMRCQFCFESVSF